MANIASAKKRARQAEERRLRNKSRRSEMRTSMKKVLKAVKAGDHGQAQVAYRDAVRVIDRTANRGVIHKNKAARHKSRLNTRVRSLAG
ncbi:MAG: 30S ribosomal protein S20 [Halorhodospira sp.]